MILKNTLKVCIIWSCKRIKIQVYERVAYEVFGFKEFIVVTGKEQVLIGIKSVESM